LRLLARCAWVCMLAWTGCLRWAKRRLRDSGAIVTLTFHRVLDDISYRTTNSLPGTVIRERTFRELVRYLAGWCEPVALADAAPGAPRETVQIAFTFDDGWRDNYTTAFPILTAYGVPVTIFVCPGVLGKTMPFWPEQVAALLRATQFDRDPRQLETAVEWLKRQSPQRREKYLAEIRERGGGYSFPFEGPEDATLSWDEIVEMDKAGICFGSHTNTHQILTTIAANLAREELAHSKAMLERVLDKPCQFFAYPNGDWSPESQQMVRETGFTQGFTTQRGVWTSASDPLAIPRSNVCESNVVGITGRFWPAMFEYTTLWKAWRATSACKDCL
jgi:peptidoglycan/xylan/chitin deacetylase (PgdA/CDA1 family)